MWRRRRRLRRKGRRGGGAGNNFWLVLILLAAVFFWPDNYPFGLNRPAAYLVGPAAGIPSEHLSLFADGVIPSESSYRQFKSWGVPLESRTNDVGIAQVHWGVHPQYSPFLLRWSTLYNLWAGASIFRNCVERKGSEPAAIVGCYKGTPPNHRYVLMALDLYQKALH